jgi:hypothetical protein
MTCGILIKKIFDLPTFMFLWSQFLHIWQIHWLFSLIFAGIKTKKNQNSLYSTAFFKILKEPTIPHMKAVILSYLELEGWGRSITMGGATPTSRKTVCYYSFWGRRGQEGWKEWIFFWLSQNSASHECTNTIFMT